MDNYGENAEQVRRRIRELNRNKETGHKNKIKEQCRITVKTVAVGALVDLEKYLGHLWGHLEEKDLTPEQQAIYEAWMDARSSILDRAENCKNILEYHIDQCTITNYDNRHKVEFRRYDD